MASNLNPNCFKLTTIQNIHSVKFHLVKTQKAYEYIIMTHKSAEKNNCL